MRRLLLPLAGVLVLVAGAIPFTLPSEAAVSGAASGMRATLDQPKLVENAACLPRRVCGFRGCRYRYVCKRSQGH
jgi:hypothetical protein